MPAAPSQTLNDFMFAYFSSIVSGAGPVLFGTQNVNVTNGLATVQQTDDLFNFSGDVAAPAAGVVMSTIAIPAAGTYDITCYTNLSGTTAGIDRPNLQIFKNAVAGPVILSTMGGITDTTVQRMAFTAAGTVSIKTIVISTPASVYRSTLMARRVA